MRDKKVGKLTTYQNACECADPGCPAHPGKSTCMKTAVTVVRRVDMEDGSTRFRMCRVCAEDALDSGVFA